MAKRAVPKMTCLIVRFGAAIAADAAEGAEGDVKVAIEFGARGAGAEVGVGPGDLSSTDVPGNEDDMGADGRLGSGSWWGE